MTYTTPDHSFEYGYIRSQKDMAGRMDPFTPCWNVQCLATGHQDFVLTRKEVFEWIADHYDITDAEHPDWLTKELRQ